MRRFRGIGVFSTFALAAVLIGACGGGGGGGGDVSYGQGAPLKIYSSLPLQGDSRSQSVDIVRGEQMALEQAGGSVAGHPVELVSLDDSTAQAGTWDPQQVASNARKAVQDDATIAYLGEFNSGACAISIPITNEAGLLQITPDASYLGLTKSIGAVQPGEPEKYYPSGLRTFGRVYPADHIQAAAQVAYMQQSGVHTLYLLHDNDTYGQGISAALEKLASQAGIDVVGGPEGVDVEAANFRAVASKVAEQHPDAIFYGACPESAAVQVFKDLHTAVPAAKLFGPDCLADTTFTKELPPEIQAATYLTAGTLPPEQYPPAGQKFFADFRQQYGTDPQIFAIYGYETMAATLDSIKRAASDLSRSKVREAFFSIKDRDSLVGTYSIDPDGDSTLSDYGAYRVRGGELSFDRLLHVQPPQD